MKETCNIIACGSGTKGFDFSTIEGDVMVVNGAITLYPDADYFIALDKGTFKRYENELSKFKGIKYNDRGVEGTVKIPQYPYVNLSGYSAIKTAQSLGYKIIKLIGFDAKGKDNIFGTSDYNKATHERMIEKCKDMNLIFLTNSAINGTL